MATVAPSSASMGNIAQLETRFFEHPYPTESSGDRLSRLEKFVFGQSRKGTDQQRLAALLAALPATGTAKAQNKSRPQPSPTQIASASDADNGSGDLTPFTRERFPMGPAGAGSEDRRAQSQPYRAVQSPDYSAYNAPAASPSPYAGAAAANAGALEPAVSALEMDVFGETRKQQGIGARLTAMENSLFGNSDHSGSLTQRVSRLQQAIQTDGGAPTMDTAATNAPQYQKGYTSRMGSGTAMNEPPRPSNGHPLVRKAVKTAVIVGAVAGVAALTVFAAKGMSHHHHLDLD